LPALQPLLLQLPQGLLLGAQATGDAEGGNVAQEERYGSTPQRLYGFRTCLRGC